MHFLVAIYEEVWYCTTFSLGGLMLEQHQEFSGLQITDLQLQAFLMRSYRSLFLVQHFQYILSMIWYGITTDKVAAMRIVNT